MENVQVDIDYSDIDDIYNLELNKYGYYTYLYKADGIFITNCYTLILINTLFDHTNVIPQNILIKYTVLL